MWACEHSTPQTIQLRIVPPRLFITAHEQAASVPDFRCQDIFMQSAAALCCRSISEQMLHCKVDVAFQFGLQQNIWNPMGPRTPCTTQAAPFRCDCLIIRAWWRLPSYSMDRDPTYSMWGERAQLQFGTTSRLPRERPLPVPGGTHTHAAM